jgi:polyisoprenyl-teichoic acid--peptidoglycan teichoic acid transferase
VAKAHAGRRSSWAVVFAAVGAALVLLSGGLWVAGQWLLARYDVAQQDLFGEPGYGENIEGPLNILLVGIDTRPGRPEEPARADAIMVVHLDETLRRGYLLSLPRDLLVDIPPFPRTGFAGGHDRLNAAMAYGSRQVGGEDLPDLGRGFSLLARTVSDLTGITRWDAGAVIDFEGFAGVVDALGGVTVKLEERIASEHRQPDGTHRPLRPDGDGYSGPQAVYEPGVHHLRGWQALDIARQRYQVEGGDFGRQRNQQLLLKAIMERALQRDVVTDPVRLDRVLREAGDSVVFDGRGHQPVDFAFALRELRGGSLWTLGVPTAAVGGPDGYQGERLEPVGQGLLEALGREQLARFLDAHPELRE